LKNKEPNKRLLSHKIDFNNTAKFIDEISSEWANSPLIKTFAQRLFRYKNPYRLLYNFLRYTTEFEKDKGVQTIRTPERLIKDDKANCVDTTCFISAVLKNFDIPHVYKMVSAFGGAPEHIYIQANGLTLDPINGRSEKNPASTNNLFNIEVKHLTETIYKPKF